MACMQWLGKLQHAELRQSHTAAAANTTAAVAVLPSMTCHHQGHIIAYPCLCCFHLPFITNPQKLVLEAAIKGPGRMCGVRGLLKRTPAYCVVSAALQKLALEAAIKGEFVRPSERRRQQMETQGSGGYGNGDPAAAPYRSGSMDGRPAGYGGGRGGGGYREGGGGGGGYRGGSGSYEREGGYGGGGGDRRGGFGGAERVLLVLVAAPGVACVACTRSKRGVCVAT
jgi:hypothetical protein